MRHLELLIVVAKRKDIFSKYLRHFTSENFSQCRALGPRSVAKNNFNPHPTQIRNDRFIDNPSNLHRANNARPQFLWCPFISTFLIVFGVLFWFFLPVVLPITDSGFINSSTDQTQIFVCEL